MEFKFSGHQSASVDIMTLQNQELPRSEHFKYLGMIADA